MNTRVHWLLKIALVTLTLAVPNCTTDNPLYVPDSGDQDGEVIADSGAPDAPPDMPPDLTTLPDILQDSATPSDLTPLCSAANCPQGICDVGTDACRDARSCYELHNARPALTSGVYQIAFATGSAAAYCDMVTDGGGWTALTNPFGTGLPLAAPGIVATAQELSGTQSCGPPVPAQFLAGDATSRGWSIYGCGDVALRLAVDWMNSLGARDVAFRATVQGQTFHRVAVAGSVVANTAVYKDTSGAFCYFWNKGGVSAPATAMNSCYKLSPTAPPLVVPGALAGGKALGFEILTGPSCSPTCQYGTGANVVQIMVR